MNFRKLKAEEVKVRVGRVGEKAVILLLYKDARVDMQILDETVGSENWQREHYECKGNLFCRVGIRTQDSLGTWVWKSDVGTESNTEEEKGEASDSFKRACTNWGIGRELYSAPLIFITLEDAKVKDGKVPNSVKFKVTEIGSTDDKIDRLTIARLDYKGEIEKEVFSYGMTQHFNEVISEKPTQEKAKRSNEPPKTYERSAKKELCVDCGSLITDAEKAFSEEKYGRALCRKCQKVAK